MSPVAQMIKEMFESTGCHFETELYENETCFKFPGSATSYTFYVIEMGEIVEIGHYYHGDEREYKLIELSDPMALLKIKGKILDWAVSIHLIQAVRESMKKSDPEGAEWITLNKFESL